MIWKSIKMFWGLVSLLIFFVATEKSSCFSPIIINEVCPTNYSSLYDDDLENCDWIELYNYTNEPINLGGWRIFDKNDFQNAYILPDTLIPPKSYVVLNASGKNKINSKYYTIEAGGLGINPWNFYDGFRFHYIEIEGDFEAQVQVHSLREDKLYSNAGLMARANLNPESPYVGIFCSDNIQKKFTFMFRDTSWRMPYFKYHWTLYYPDGRIKLKKLGKKMYAYRFFSNWYWELIDSCEHTLGQKVYLGLAFSNYDDFNIGRATFSNLIINGDTIDFSRLSAIEINTKKFGRAYISNEIHTNFKLSSKGEKIYLWNKEGKLIDTLTYPTLKADVSFGKFPDGFGLNYYFINPTPNKKNVDPKIEISKDPEFSLQAGWYDYEIELEFINNEENYRIFYTLDGSEPTDSTGILYNGEKIILNKTTAVRAKGYKYYCVPSKTITKTYFINERKSKLPVFSIVTDSIYLWSKEFGVFYPFNLFADIESPVNFEFFDNNYTANYYSNLYYNSGASIKVHGTTTRYFPQKAFTLNTRARYDTTLFSYQFFPGNPYNTYDKILLRASGQDWYKTLLRDGFASVLAKRIGLDASSHRPTVLYINCSYWGIQNLREKIDEEHLSIKYKIPEENINLLEDNIRVLNGTPISFTNLLDSLSNPEINDSVKILCIKNKIDLENLTKYTIFRIWSGIYDWPDYNQKYWCSPDYDNKWRWAVWDSDVSMGFGSPPNVDLFQNLFNTNFNFSKIFSYLIIDTSFRTRFIQTFSNLLNTHLHPKNTIRLLDSLADLIADEIPYHQARWDSSAINWSYQIDTLKDFLNNRTIHLQNQLQYYFNIDKFALITVKIDTSKARFRINQIDFSEFPTPDSIFYPNNIPISFEITPKYGYKFVSWANELLPDTTLHCSVTLSNIDSITIAPILQETIAENPHIIFNEIMYKTSSDWDCGDWVELYNTTDKDIDLSNWIFKDDNDSHIFTIPQNTIIKAYNYLVLCENTSKFSTIYPDVKNYVGDFNFGLGRPDIIRLYDKFGVLIDSVAYSNKSPWDEKADNTGFSLELIYFGYNRNNPTSWRASFIKGGTPGKENSKLLNIESFSQIEEIQVTCYPSPFGDYLIIHYTLPNEQSTQIIFYNYAGNLITKIEQCLSKEVKFTLDTKNLPPGAYFCLIQSTHTNKNIRKIIPLLKVNH